jgi:hypothetical protein
MQHAGIVVHSGNRTKEIDTHCEKNVEFWKNKALDSNCDPPVLRGQSIFDLPLSELV